ncbi:hypothetical protein UPYG_G00226950 [Umbra pygmaea]|uniref:Uncharacterized protein n=1 Tax=Umbra pygmaea TaxID=75934 RepID=A0ABD0WCL5_UMBPY
MTLVNLVCIESTGISKVEATAPSSTPLHATASIVAKKTFSQDHTLLLIDLLRLQMEAESQKHHAETLAQMNGGIPEVACTDGGEDVKLFL